MKKIIFAIGVCFLLVGFGGHRILAKISDVLHPDEIYIFTQATCHHCWDAEDFLRDEYPDLKVQKRDIADSKNRVLFFACGAKFKLDQAKMGTPLFCMGDHYIMGWGRSERKKFNEYVKEFLPELQK